MLEEVGKLEVESLETRAREYERYLVQNGYTGIDARVHGVVDFDPKQAKEAAKREASRWLKEALKRRRDNEMP
jgi:hypothetical protein